MKRITILILATFAIPCSGQWHNAYMSAQIYAFGVHDTSLFIGINPAGTPDPIVWRLVSLTPNVIWVIADTGMTSAEGNVISFASLGNYFYANEQAQYSFTYQTTNNGSSWLGAIGSDVASNGQYLYGVSARPFTGNPYIALSRDSGQIWDSVATFNNGSWITNFIANGVCIFAKTGSAIWRSRDTGNTWSQIQPTFTGTITPMGTLLFIPGNGELAVSTDSGTQWTTVPVDSAGMPLMVNCLATDGKNLFAGTPTGILVSTDTGRDWMAENDSLIYKNISVIGVFDTLLFIDVSNIGPNSEYAAYYRPISEITKPPSAVQLTAQAATTLSIYPNPLTNSATIEYSLAEASPVTITIYDALGKTISIPDPGYEETSGEHEVTFDAQSLPSGTYWCHLTAGSVERVAKLVISK